MEFRTLKAEEIDVRVQSVGKSKNGYYAIYLLYKDARCDMNILDETIGALNWKRHHEVVNDNLYCTVSIYNEATKEWVSKQDVGIESNTQKEKGEASDSFKRACFNWGIGRELYTSPAIFVNLDQSEVVEKGKPTTHLKLSVSKIKYKDKKIVELELKDNKGKTRFYFGEKPKKEAPKGVDDRTNALMSLYKEFKGNKTFMEVMKGNLKGRKVSELSNEEKDELIMLIESMRNTLEG